LAWKNPLSEKEPSEVINARRTDPSSLSVEVFLSKFFRRSLSIEVLQPRSSVENYLQAAAAPLSQFAAIGSPPAPW
jgi:hypothetical protein